MNKFGENFHFWKNLFGRILCFSFLVTDGEITINPDSRGNALNYVLSDLFYD